MEKMKTENITIIAVLPIGEFDNDLVKNEVDAITGAFDNPDTKLIIANPVSNKDEAQQSVRGLSKKGPRSPSCHRTARA